MQEGKKKKAGNWKQTEPIDSGWRHEQPRRLAIQCWIRDGGCLQQQNNLYDTFSRSTEKRLGPQELSISYQISMEDLLCIPQWKVLGTPPMHLNVLWTCILIRTFEVLEAKEIYKRGVLLNSQTQHIIWGGMRFWSSISDWERELGINWPKPPPHKPGCFPLVNPLSPAQHLAFLSLPLSNSFMAPVFHTIGENSTFVLVNSVAIFKSLSEDRVTKIFNTSNQTNDSSMKEILCWGGKNTIHQDWEQSAAS